jgi:aryl-alcohol dehydrogenase-like predicted oxidoreductase
MKRVDFIKTAALSIPALSLFPASLSGINREFSNGLIEKRSLGMTGEKLSVIGFGGIIVRDVTTNEAAEAVRFAIESGVNYFDIAPSYGNAEVMLGPALKPYRDQVFLSCKTTERTKEGARRELEQSLINMHTDYFDLYQFHAVTNVSDVETIFSKGGALETVLEAQKEGKIQYIGFSAHSVEAALALMAGFDFDTIMFPVNIYTWYGGNFGAQVLDIASKKKMGILALKAMAKSYWPQGADRSHYRKLWYEPCVGEEEITRGLRFALSHPVTSAIPPGDFRSFKEAIAYKNQLSPLKPQEIEEIKLEGQRISPLFRFAQG